MPNIKLTLPSIPTDRPYGLEHAGKPIVVLRQGDKVSAFVDCCPHAGWKLSDGDVNEGVLECPGHSWEFNTLDGKCVTMPAVCLTPLNVKVDGDAVQIEWEDEPDEI